MTVPGPTNDYHHLFAARDLEPTVPILAELDVGAGADDVWVAISETGYLKRVHPFCAENRIERWPGADGRDHIRYYSGVHYQRDVLAWREGVGYDLAVGPPSVGPIALARWTVEPKSDASSRFVIEVTSFVRADVTGAARDRYVETAIARGIPPYLEAVVRGVGHYAETGDPVRRNQFGAHETYSPAID